MVSQAGPGQAFHSDFLDSHISTRNSVPILQVRNWSSENIFALDYRAHKGQGWHSGSSTARGCLSPPEEGPLPSWPSLGITTLLLSLACGGAEDEVRAVAVISAHLLLELCWNEEGRRKERCSVAGVYPASCSPRVHERLGTRGRAASTVPSRVCALLT